MSNRLSRYLQRPEVRDRQLPALFRRSYLEFIKRAAPARLSKLHRSSLRLTPYKIDAPLTESVGQSLFLYGVYEPLATAVFASLLDDGDTAIDVGAHYGDYTLVAASKVGSAGSVYAFEPQARVRALLERNLVLNGIRHVTVVSEALADYDGESRLYSCLDPVHTGGSSLSSAQVGQSEFFDTVPVRRLDDVMSSQTEARTKALKIDVEGQEAAVLKGARSLLRRTSPSVIFEVNGLSLERDGFGCEAFSELSEQGYLLYGMLPEPTLGFRLERLTKDRDPRRYSEPWLALNILGLVPGSESHERMARGGHMT